MSDTFAALNGDDLSPVETLRRKLMIEELLAYLTENDCCRQAPNWRDLIYRMPYGKLQRRYADVFGRAVIDDPSWKFPENKQ